MKGIKPSWRDFFKKDDIVFNNLSINYTYLEDWLGTTGFKSESNTDKDNNAKFLSKIDKHAQSLSALIDDILEISKLESKKELGKFADTSKFQ